YDVLELLMRFRDLHPAEVYPPGLTIPSGRSLASVPPPLLEQPLPLEVAVSDSMRNLGDFWNTMKVAWRPALLVTVTVPVLLQEADIEQPLVTTLAADHRQTDVGASETTLTVGGRVVASGDTQGVKGAWVQIQGLSPASVQAINRRMVSGDQGGFLFE